MKTKIIGLEKINEEWLSNHKGLELIVKRGIGIDNIDMKECQNRCIFVCNTPDAPSNAVAELTICQMLNMLRKVPQANMGRWNRYVGRELNDCTVGVIGTGRIGKRVIYKTSGIGCKHIYFSEINEDNYPWRILDEIELSTNKWIFQNCDIITIHIPLKDQNIDNTDFITKKELNMMKPNVRLLNMSRGGIINESDLFEWLKTHKKATCALDSYIEEPYKSKLLELKNIYLTPHLGSCTITSKAAMQKQAEEEVQRYLNGEELKNRVI